MKSEFCRFVSASLPVNKPKNRLVHLLPYENTRVCLSGGSSRGMEGSDYINANFIDGYRQRCAYIATQGPLQITTDDFWRMLWEHNSTIVVMLTKLHEMGRVIINKIGIIKKNSIAKANILKCFAITSLSIKQYNYNYC